MSSHTLELQTVSAVFFDGSYKDIGRPSAQGLVRASPSRQAIALVETTYYLTSSEGLSVAHNFAGIV